MQVNISLFDQILKWSNETFRRGNAPGEPIGVINHLKQEWDELVKSDFRDVEEMADIVFMLIQLADARDGNLEEAVAAKLLKNMQRNWPSEPDEFGVFNHIE